MKKILFIAVLICGIFANGQDTGFVYSGGIPTGTGIKVQDKTPVDDRFVRQDSASLHTTPYLYDGAFLVDIDTYSLWIYDEPNDTFIKLAKEGQISDIQIFTTLNDLITYEGNSNIAYVEESQRGGFFIRTDGVSVDGTFTYNSASGGVWERVVTTDSPANVLWNLGVDDTGATDSREGLLEVYNAAIDRGFTKVYHPEGFYYLDSTMVAPPNLHYYGAGKGKTILSFNGNGADYGVQISGSYEEIGEISSIVEKGANSIQIDTNVSLNPQDLIVVSDTIEGSYGISYYREGEFFKVKDSVTLADTINLETGILADGYPVGAKVSKVAKNWVKISDMTLVGNRTVPLEPTSDAFNILLELNLLQDVEVYNLEMSNVNATMFAMYAVYGGKIYNNDINLTYYLEGGTGSEISKTRHGLISYGSVNLDIYENNIYANRHAIDMADNVRGCANLGISPCVVSRNINVNNNRLSSSIESAANMHAGEYVIFENNIIDGGILINGNHVKVVGNTVFVKNSENNGACIDIGSSSLKGVDVLIDGNYLSGRNSTVIPEGATAIYGRLNWSSTGLISDGDSKVRILNNTIVQEDSDSEIYVVNIRSRPGIEPDIEFSGNKIQNKSTITNQVSIKGFNQSSSWGAFNDVVFENNKFENVKLRADRNNSTTIRNNQFKGLNYNAVTASSVGRLDIFGNQINSNLTAGGTAETTSTIFVDVADLVVVDQNTFDTPNNTYRLNINTATSLVRGKQYQVSGNSAVNLANVTNNLDWDYYFKNITADAFIVNGGTSTNFLVGDGTTRTIVPTDFGVNTSGRIIISTGSGDGWGNLSYSSTSTGSNTLAQRTGTGGRLKMGTPTDSDDGVTLGYANSTYQPIGTYLTANQTITLSGDLTGSGTTAITGTIANDAVTNTKLANMAEGTIKGRVASGTGDPQDLTLDAVIKAMGLAIPVIYDLEDFTLPAMSAPPAQNSFSPITILSSVSIPANMIDWEITWTASGIHYKLSSIGDYNIELRESSGNIQISGQTRSQSAIAVDDTTNEPKIIFYVKPE